jgi:hypothetical protein
MIWGGGSYAYRVMVGKSEGRNHLEDLGIEGRIIMKWILNRMGKRGQD